MDQRVLELWDRLTSYREADEMPIVDLRDQVLDLHAAIDEEESRVALLNMFNLICDIAEAHLQQSGIDLTAFQAHRRGQVWMFLRAESLVGGELDRLKLVAVTDREVRAGRMASDDRLRRYALGDDAAFEDDPTLH